MRRWIGSMASLLMLLGLSGVGPAQNPDFELSVDAPASLPESPAGTIIEYVAVGRLTTLGLTEGDDGAQGWSLSVAVEGGTPVDATTAGTAVDSYFSDGFDKTEVVDPAENSGVHGAVSAIVLSMMTPSTLPPTGTADILRLTIQAKVPDPVIVASEPQCEPLESRVFYLDGLRGSGQPVDNKITFRGQTTLPTKGEAVTTVCPKFERPLTYVVTVVSPYNSTPGEGPSEIDIAVPLPVGLRQIVAGVILKSRLSGEIGAQGWSLSVETEPCFAITDATTSGTAVDSYFSNGFNKTEVVDPAKNSGKQGAVSAVVLSFTERRELPVVSDSLVLKLFGSLDGSTLAAPGDKTGPCLVAPSPPGVNGLTGSGQPVKSAVTVAGKTRNPQVLSGDLRLVAAPDLRFLRGDPNDDGKTDIADCIWIINDLFRQGPNTVCQDAADVNDDGFMDSADAVYLIAYLFQSGPPPEPPFDACDNDPTEDGLACAASAKGCQQP